MVTSSDSDKEGSDSPCEQEVTGRPPRVIAPLTDRTVVAGQSTTFECTVADGDEASIRWFRDSEQLEPSDEFEHIFDGCVAKLVIARVLPTCAGTYRCMVLTPGGEAETSASIVVEGQTFLFIPTKLSCTPSPHSVYIHFINYGPVHWFRYLLIFCNVELCIVWDGWSRHLLTSLTWGYLLSLLLFAYKLRILPKVICSSGEVPPMMI